MKHEKNPTKKFFFDSFGGQYVPEMLIPALNELDNAYINLIKKTDFKNELMQLFKTYAGRPTPLHYASNLTEKLHGCKIYLKLENLAHTGAHKINNALGQGLLAKKMGKKVLIAETGAGQHGVATATVAAKLNMKCVIFMGEVDMKRQYPNVYTMRLLGAEIIPVSDGSKTLKDAVNAAMKYWMEHISDHHYLLGSALGPYPYPKIVRNFQSIIGKEALRQIKKIEGRVPDVLVACVGGGSNSIGLFYPFLKYPSVKMIGVEAGGKGTSYGEHAVRLNGRGKIGIVQGYKSYFLTDEYGQIQTTHSISAGLDYAGIGPELASLYKSNRIEFTSVTDKEALLGFHTLCKTEGIVPALESSHAVAFALKNVPLLPRNQIMIINISGRGEKDIFVTAKEFDNDAWVDFLKREVSYE